MSTNDFKLKQKETFNKKYGVDFPLSLKSTHEKALRTMYLNNTTDLITSSQQKYINNLYNGKLNYPCKNYALDIVLLDDMLNIEYDGKGHNLSVKLGELTQEEFNKNELIRDKIVKSHGYRVVRIISRKDYLPSDSKLLEILDYSRNYFKLNPERSWIEFDIDNSTVRNALCKDNAEHYDFGNLRKLPRKTA